ncbi:hypothetical protein ACO2Q9_18690 [Variovorax sp. VNK109]|jgi:hypothetical protein|uniref:hypothetical protein n=1 Tax=Variovorax sp. VNK109 TaxID=3400919 RepID=UPI003C0D635A
MLERLRKALFSKPASPPPSTRGPDTVGLSIWAERQGLRIEPSADGKSFRVSGASGDIDWQLETGAPTRNFIRGGELRGRTELGLHQDVSILILNRHLKEALEQHAFAEFTDSLRTEADAALTEEVRWLSMYEEVAIRAAPIGFADMYAVLADNRIHAQAWVTEAIATDLMRWPEAVGPKTPITLLTLRGNVYLRIEFPTVSMDVLSHAARVYGAACAQAAAALPRQVARAP